MGQRLVFRSWRRWAVLLGLLTGVVAIISAVRRLGGTATSEASRTALKPGPNAAANAVVLHHTAVVQAPTRRVFEAWSVYRNLAHFLPGVIAVRALGGNRLHWTVPGPDGKPQEWEAELTRFVPDRILAWDTLPGAPVKYSGGVRFEGEGEGSTRVDVELRYEPAAGSHGQADEERFSALAGSLEATMLRMKSFVEASATAPAQAAVAAPPAGEAHAVSSTSN